VNELQVVGVVESLKVPNEVRLTNGGIIENVLVEDGQGVEFGQPLLELQIDG
jgi:acetyl-CoA carboxylase biotin carboxyl carrier protein